MDAWLEAHRAPLALALLAALAVGVGVWLQRSGDERPLVVSASPPAATPAGGLMVYVSGAVAWPGVYTFREGDRVEQAIAAAGGPTDEADTAGLNLAIRLRDEQRVHVPRRDEPTSPSASATAGSPVDAPAAAPLIDLNTASLAELEALPGVGVVTAQRIVDYRARNGLFRQVEDLKTAKLVNNSTYEKVRTLVTVR